MIARRQDVQCSRKQYVFLDETMTSRPILLSFHTAEFSIVLEMSHGHEGRIPLFGSASDQHIRGDIPFHSFCVPFSFVYVRTWSLSPLWVDTTAIH
jgi:hypothetical protein